MRKLIPLVFALAYLSCSSPGNKTEKDSGKKEDDVTPSHATSHVVAINQMKFDPSEIKIHKGDTIIWVNNDMVTHCITDEKDKAWTSSQLLSGASWKKVFTNRADYYCAIHQVMKGKIVVE